MNISYLSIGTNLGDKLQNIKNAYISLQQKVNILKSSSIYETLPQEMSRNAPNFLNSVIKIETSLSPFELLQFTQDVEKKLGRKNKNDKKSRIIDIDIILYENKIIKTKELVIPHPRMLYRDFVVYPLLEIEPELIYPIGNIKLKSCIRLLTPKNIKKYADTNFNIINSSSKFHGGTSC